MRLRAQLRPPKLALLALVVALTSGCDLVERLRGERAAAKSSDAGASPSAPAAATVTSAAMGDAPPPGPAVTIPAGSFKAGSPCASVPRVTSEELEAETVTLGEFSIDVFPYPNDPQAAPRTDVTREEAAALCAAQNKRLCTELEWERACKGPAGTSYEYGATYSPKSCAAEALPLPDRRPRCVSGFGVKDMHGLVWEWTASAWGRGTSGNLATIRGGPARAGALQARCQNGQGRPPETSSKEIGFRCCSGPTSPAVVNLQPSKQPPMVEEPSVESSLAKAMLEAMPADHRKVEGHTLRFTNVWRWHPREHEELLIGLFTARKGPRGAPSQKLAVFKVCGNRPLLVAAMKGPAARVGKPGAGADPQKASAEIEAGADKGEVKLTYSYGAVKVEEPPWVKPGLLLEQTEETGERPRLPVLRRPGLRPPAR